MLYQFLPRLADDEYAALEKSIRDHGVQVPIVVDENRSVIDGHHRKEIADRLGVDCPRRFAVDLTDEQKRTLSLSLNLDRRHLSREQKQDLVRKSLAVDPHLSDRQHADRTGVAHTTVGRARSDLEATGALHQSDMRTSADGRARPSTQPAHARIDTETAGPDNKTYPQPEPKAPKRKPLPDQARTAGWELRKSVERLERIAADDRFTPNKEQMASHLRGHLTHAVQVCQDLLTRIDTN